MDISALDNRQNLRILVLFLIVQFMGLLLATQVYNGLNVQPAQVGQQAAGFPSGIVFLVTYIALIVVVSFVLLLLIRRGSNKILLLFEAFAILGGSFFFYLILIGVATLYLPLSVLSNTLQLVLAGIFSVATLYLKYKIPRTRNPISVISSVGIGIMLGLNIGFGTALLFMFILAVYDFIAVFITKHMVAMGQAAVDMNLALIVVTSEGMALPASEANKSQKKIASMQRNSLFKNYKYTMTELKDKDMIPIIMPRGLGNGDLAVPLMLATSSYLQYLNFTVPIVITIGAATGLMITFSILKKYRRALPAIPPLLFGIMLALTVYFIILRVI